jgi:hypothetical protein
MTTHETGPWSEADGIVTHLACGFWSFHEGPAGGLEEWQYEVLQRAAAMLEEFLNREWHP